VSAGFVRELLLGPDAVKPAQRSAIGSYFRDVVVDRGFPVHVASLWNALYFSWDLRERGYHGAGLNTDRIELRAFGATDRAVPVGGFVRVASGKNEAWGEVVYKEGRHPDADPGTEFPPGVSGGEVVPSGDPPRALVREALIVDWCAFGPEWNEAAALARLRRRERLDAYGHLVMTAVYEDSEAELDDTAYFASSLLRNHREGLLAEFVEADTTDDELYTLLLVSLATVADIAAHTRGLVMNAHYAIAEADYRALVSDGSAGNPVGRDFFTGISRSVVSVPARGKVSYTATGQAVLEHLGRDGGLDTAERELLDGPGYGRLVTYANLHLADELAGITDGVVTRYAGGPFHLRRDDAWQWGGVWRSERVRLDDLPAYVRVPPLIALGLGAASARPPMAEAPGAAPITDPVTIMADRRSWRVTLSDADIDAGRLPVGPATRFLDRLAGSTFRLKVFEEGVLAAPFFNGLVLLERHSRTIMELEWGAEVFGGVFLYCSVGRDGSSVWAELRPLVPPEMIDGIRYEYEHDRLVRPSGRKRLPASTFRRAGSFRDAIGLAFRAVGEPLDGGYAADALTLAAAIGGRDVASGLLSLVVAEVRAAGCELTADGRYLWRPVVTRQTRGTEAELLRAAAGTEGEHLARHIRPHVVRMHLRRWEHRDPATWDARAAAYGPALAECRSYGLRSATLPRGYTFVREHEVGEREVQLLFSTD
jgi:hypothetical protein